VHTTGPGAERPLFLLVQDRLAEISGFDHGTGETRLEEHGVVEAGPTQIRTVEPAGETDHITHVGTTEIGLVEAAAVEHRTAQIAVAEVEPAQVGLQELLLLQLPPVHVGLQILQGTAATQFRGCDGLRSWGHEQTHGQHQRCHERNQHPHRLGCRHRFPVGLRAQAMAGSRHPATP